MSNYCPTLDEVVEAVDNVIDKLSWGFLLNNRLDVVYSNSRIQVVLNRQRIMWDSERDERHEWEDEFSEYGAEKDDLYDFLVKELNALSEEFILMWRVQ